MAYQVNTTGAKPGEEDNDVSSISSKPTLKAFLSQEMGQSAVQIHTNLVSNVGITDIDSLIFIFESDLNELCQELGLKFGDKIKFKSAVSKLQHTFKPKQFVTISSKEQPHIDKINIAIKQANDLQTALQKHLNRIDDHIASAESQVNAQIDGVIESLQRRKKTLQQNLNEWKLGQLDTINKEMAKIWEYHNALKSAKRGIDDLLTKPDASRHKKIKEIVDDLLSDNEKYKGYQDNKSLEQYLINHTKMIGVTFQEMKPLESYGELDSNIKNDAFRIPSIVLESAIKTAENENGFQTKLKWEFMSNKEHKSTRFVVKHAVDNNDQKEDQSEDDLKIDWIVLDEPQIEQEEKNKYSLNVANYFKFDTKYLFQIEKIVNEPIEMLILSNITSTIVEGKWLDMSKEEQIPLKIGSHSGHHGSYVPEIILRSDDEYYLSPDGQITNQWIILNVDNDATYYPTKLQVRARGTNQGSSGDGYALKRFALKIGNTDRNEWIQLNEELF
eukprot:824868_1